MDIPTITTPRLTLRPFATADFKAMHNILSGQDVLRYFPSTTPPTEEQTRKLIARMLKHWQDNGYGLWAVESRHSGALMGRCGLQYIPETAEVEVDFILGRDHWGQGFATEAGQAGIEFGFDKIIADVIIGIVHPDNIASQRVLEKIGLHFVEATEYFGMAVYRYLTEKPKYLRPNY